MVRYVWPLMLLLFLLTLFCGFRLFAGWRLGPETVSGAMNENVLERRLGDGERVGLAGGRLYHIGYKPMSLVGLQPRFPVQHRSGESITRRDLRSQFFRMIRFQQD